MIRWFRDIIIEATFEGRHTIAVQKGITLGFLLFLVSEIMFFFSFFWAFFSNALSPSIFIGGVWPPLYFKQIDVLGLPLLNTMLLLMSGVTITYSHRALLTRNKHLATDGLIWTLIFGFAFILCQLYEYRFSYFSINDGIYGSVFYILTGFHGLHVIIGCCFLSVALARLIHFHFTSTHHVGYEISVLYWHMVDIVWLFLFLFVYLWGSGEYNLDTFFESLDIENVVSSEYEILDTIK
jgi:cytochrome c oxidase subunit 3